MLKSGASVAVQHLEERVEGLDGREGPKDVGADYTLQLSRVPVQGQRALLGMRTIEHQPSMQGCSLLTVRRPFAVKQTFTREDVVAKHDREFCPCTNSAYWKKYTLKRGMSSLYEYAHVSMAVLCCESTMPALTIRKSMPSGCSWATSSAAAWRCRTIIFSAEIKVHAAKQQAERQRGPVQGRSDIRWRPATRRQLQTHDSAASQL